MPGTGSHRHRSQRDAHRGVSQRNATKGRGKKHVKRAIRAFFLWGWAIWRGKLITTTAELGKSGNRLLTSAYIGQGLRAQVRRAMTQ